MPRPVHQIDTEARDYTLVSKEPYVFEFRAPPQEIAHMRKPRAVVQGRGGNSFDVTGVKIIPGPPVDGELLVQLTATRIV